MKIETGVMIMKDGLAWGIKYADGYTTEYDWISPEDAKIYNPKYLKKPTDATYKDSPHKERLAAGKLVQVERRTEVIIIQDNASA